jgi:hypothetical protein
MSGTGAYSSTGSLFAQPVGPRESGAVRVELGPYYLFAPPPNPVIQFIRDVPNDQGRSVRIRWRNDLRERPYSPSDTLPRITSYTLYRRVEPGQTLGRHAQVEKTRSARVPGATGIAAALRTTPASEEAILTLPPGEWDVLTTIPATLDTTYQTVVPTLCDSTPDGTCWSIFLVRAITDQPGTYFSSAADSGYSVDNLVPGVPEGLSAQPVPDGIALSWQPSTAPDFQHFRIYRGADPDFLPGPTTLVHATASTNWTDPAQDSFTYKVTAVDFNGNESQPAVTSVTVGAGDGQIPKALALVSLAPNPFRRHLTILVEVPEASGAVNLTLFDVAGRRVATLVSSELPAGRHSFTWDGRQPGGSRAAAGVYVAKLTGAGRTFSRRVTLLR